MAGSGVAGAATGAETATDAASASNGQSPAARLDAEMGYGVAAFAGTLTPYGGVALSEGCASEGRRMRGDSNAIALGRLPTRAPPDAGAPRHGWG